MDYAVEEMADTGGGVELIVGARNDPLFGPLGLIGFGGIHAELLRDFQLRLAPVAEKTAVAAIEQLQGTGLLSGARGRTPLDIAAAARCLSAVSSVAAEHPEIAEIEINPLLLTPEGATGLDARIVMAQSPKTPAGQPLGASND